MISYVWLWKCSKVRARWTMASDSCSDGWPITCWSVGGCSSIPDDSFIFNSGMRSGSAIDVLTSGPVADCCDNPLFWPGFPHHLTGFFWLDAPSYRRHNSLPSAFCLFYDFGSTILQHLGMFSSIINDFVALDRLWYPFRPSFIIEGFLRDFWGGFWGIFSLWTDSKSGTCCFAEIPAVLSWLWCWFCSSWRHPSSLRDHWGIFQGFLRDFSLWTVNWDLLFW